MRLTAWEEERLLLFAAAELARRHRAAGLRLNAPEAIALICDAMLEAARAGGSPSVEAAGRAAVAADDVLDGVRELVDEVRLEVLVDDGTRLVVLADPLGGGRPIAAARAGGGRPGCRRAAARPRTIASDDRADRSQHVPAGRPGLVAHAVRPGERPAGVRPAERRRLPPRPARRAHRSAGRRARSGRSSSSGSAGRRRRARRAAATDDARAVPGASVSPGSARRPATGSGSATPTCGSASREDRQAPGDEPIWGYAQERSARGWRRPAGRRPSELDAVVAGVVVIDPTIGVVKADIGIKDGRIVGVGRAGNPGISDGIELEIGPHTAPIMGYGLIATPGAVDSHVHLISPELLPAALSGGVTTLDHGRLRGAAVGDGADAGGADRLAAERRAPGLRPLDGRGGPRGARRRRRDRVQDPRGLRGDAGADRRDARVRGGGRTSPVALHTDGLHESAELEDTIAAIAGRTVHAYHVEGTGGGHVPDLLGLVREANIICSSTTPTLPFGRHTAAEHVPMIVLNHGGSMARRRRRRARRGADPPGDDGRRGAAPRPRRDPDRQLRFAGDGPDHGDGPADAAARAA